MVTTVGTSTTSGCLNWTPLQCSFRALGRFWVFYGDGANLVFKTSTTGAAWSGSTVVRAMGEIRHFSICHYNKKVYYVVYISGTEFLFRQGTLNAAGGIAWTSAEVTVTDPTVECYDPNININLTGYPVISYDDQSGSVECLQNSKNNGTWTTAWSRKITGLGLGSACRTMPLYKTDGKLYLIWVVRNALPIQWQVRSAAGAWGGTNTGPSPSYGNRWDACEDPTTGDILVAYGLGTDFRIHNLDDAATETGCATILSGSSTSMNRIGNGIRIFYQTAASTLKYKDKTDGAWQAEVQISAAETSLATGLVSSYRRQHDGYVGLVWRIGAASPYSVRQTFFAPISATKTLFAKFRIGGAEASEDLFAKFKIGQSGTANLFAEFIVAQNVSDLPAEFRIRHPGSNDLEAEFLLRYSTFNDLFSKFSIRQIYSSDLKAIFKVRRSDFGDLSAEFVVGQNISNLPARFYLMQGVDIVEPTSVTTSDYDAAIRYPIQELSFFAANRHWIFYSASGKMSYRTSPDGRAWSAATDIGAISVSGNMTVHFDGEYLHVSRIYVDTMYYRRGKPNTDGSITWGAAEQIIVVTTGANELLHASIAALAGGYPAIAYNRYDGSGWRARVKISDNNDGTWSGSEAEFTLNNASSTSWGTKLLTFGSGLYVLYARDLYTIRAREYNGSWQGEEDTGYDTRIGVTWSATLRNGEIHVSFVEDTSRDIYHGYRSVGGIWQAGNPVMVGIYTNHGVQIVSSEAALYVFWLDMVDNAIVYRKSLDDGSTWLDEAENDTFQKFVDSPSPINYNYDIQVYETKTGGHIGMMWLTGIAPLYTIYFADIGPLTATALNLFSKFVVRHADTKDLSATFHVGQDSQDLSAETIIRHSTSSNLVAEIIIRHSSLKTLKAVFVVKHAATKELKTVAVIRQTVSSDLRTEFKVRHSAIRDLEASMVARHSASKDIPAELIVIHWRDLKAIFSVYSSGSFNLKAVFRLRQENLELSAEAIIRHSASADLAAESIIRQTTSKELRAIFVVRHSQFIRRRIYCKFKVRHSSVLDLRSTFKVSQATLVKDLGAEFFVNQFNALLDLGAEFYVRPDMLDIKTFTIEEPTKRGRNWLR